ncbi:hypothetical protein [Shewanella saliphila]|uniref:Uncharacterized protein n=1 Tax=Shewanella saliphila TaxID=2282698 RepID=A0ABQ2Q915_9GAMM|nr:hypothetical protein [Shewanella saliphila]MCL1100797.1 hypothetical protein [Shewanella saliphila]GGP64218.1 hypothetical protein GCM10009409_32080 [Shewanella saliphila]
MISLDEWQQHGQFEQLNGQQIFTRTEGQPSAPNAARLTVSGSFLMGVAWCFI